MEKQTITVGDAVDRDIFGFAVDKGWMCVQILYMRAGENDRAPRCPMFPYYGERTRISCRFVTQYYSDNPALPKEVLLAPEFRRQLEEGGPPKDRQAGDGSGGDRWSEWLKIKVSAAQAGQRSGQMVDDGQPTMRAWRWRRSSG